MFYNFVAPSLKNFPTALGLFGAPVLPVPLVNPDQPEHPLDLSNNTNFKKSPPTQQQGEKKSRFLSKKAVAILQTWYQKHRDHPYATDDEVRELALAGGITPNQVSIDVCIV